MEGPEEKLHFTYDLQGSIPKSEGSRKTTQYSYNPLNQQTEVVTPEGFQKNRYDPEGLRAEMEENGSLVRFVFHNREMLLEMDASETPVSRFKRGYGIEGCGQAGQTYYYHKDEHQSISLTTDEAGKAENCYQYDAFGVIVQSQEGIHNRITYSGQQYDGVTGQFYLRSRYYNPVLGRFQQEDTYRRDGLNLYAYCANNPVCYYDPSEYSKSSANSCQSDKLESGESIADDRITVGEDGQSTVYRVIRSDEDPAVGLTAKIPNRGMTVEGHVSSGSRNKGSQYISTTTNLGVAETYAAQDGNRIVEIDLNSLNSDAIIYDLSTEVGRSEYLKGITARSFARRSSEVLIEGYIPPEAITLIRSKK